MRTFSGRFISRQPGYAVEVVIRARGLVRPFACITATIKASLLRSPVCGSGRRPQRSDGSES